MSGNNTSVAQTPDAQQANCGLPLPSVEDEVGNIKVLVSDTQNTLLKKVVADYLETRTVKMPEPDDTERDILGMLESCYKAVNNLRGLNGRRNLGKTPDVIPKAAIAELIMNLYHVRLINTAGKDTDEDYSLLGIYQESGPNEGLYVTKEVCFKRIIRQYNESISGHDSDDVLVALREKAYAAGPVERNSDKDLIAVNNGIFDYRSKTLMPFSPNHVFLAKSRVNYNPAASNVFIHNDEDGTDWDVESWMRSLHDDDDMVDLMWQLLGAVIRPFVQWDMAAWFYAKTGNNGKGTLCELMRQLCGEETCYSLPLADFGKDFMLEPLTRAAAIITDENDNVFLDKVANLKAIITGDVVMVNRKFKQAIAYRFRGFMVQCLNDMPRVRDRTNAFFRRQIFVPFEKCFTGHERKYIKHDYLHRAEVLEYVMYKVLNMTYYQLSVPKKCQQALADYKDFNDPLRQFVDEVMAELKWDFVPLPFLFDLYTSWHKKAYPSGVSLGKANFRTDLEAILKETGKWEFRTDKDGRPKQQRIGHLLDNVEPLIAEYNLRDWMNLRYLGANDIIRLCTPVLVKGRKYRGIYRVGVEIEDGDDEPGKGGN